MKIAVTGADGFLGWHLRTRVQALTDHQIVPLFRSNWQSLHEVAASVDAFIHLAGANRGTDDDVYHVNVHLAKDIANAVRSSGRTSAIVFANSIQATQDNPYGHAKRIASDALRTASHDIGAKYTDVLLPNLFGEHARPDYNSFVATFIDRLISGAPPTIDDRSIALLHAQPAAQALLDGLTSEGPKIEPVGTPTTVGTVLEILVQQHASYRRGEFPSIGSRLETDLFNSLRASMLDLQPFTLIRRSDARGALVETVRAHGSEGQSFVSTTSPGVTRGQHFHLRKVERFVVISGTGVISLRKMFTSDVLEFEVSGESPVAVDMPTGWAHKITNIGSTELITQFWTNELFDPEDTDTYAEEV